ncbi:uncharacterized protein [Procambarus clarkii]|uniref:uncharacterized protein n=1 Tax=Procambarus clarkii TaxID=6728 RepID=UPI001E6746BD|nr:uncharacterized protein LOC123761614 [Procambarus clarkii]
MLTSKCQRISLIFWTVINVAYDQVGGDDGPPTDSTWGQQLYIKLAGLHNTSSDYEDNQDLSNWVLDEEHIFAPYKTTHHATLDNTQHELWWKVTSEDDPAMDAEPGPWDGKGLLNTVSSNLFLHYELIQNSWEENEII